ncbi:acyltransferase family protein [Luteibacter sp.]|uniref:acyltransferase family protein n=1 Tax=Luteibacter sp. TaxID=1886636 RepID=UPI003F818E57
MKKQSGKLDWIQALRGIAAMMVVLVHSRFILQGTDAGKAVADTVMFPMAMGVDLFFLISGFLMVLTTSNFDGSRTYAWVFFVKRIARIWPLYAIVSIAAVALEHKGINGFYDPAVLVPFLEGLIFLPHDPVSSPLYFLMSVSVAWTLCFEFYFYVVFAVAMLFGRFRYLAMAAWFALTLILVPAMRAGFTLSLINADPSQYRYLNLAICPIVWDFVLGMLAAWLYKSRFVIRRPAIIYAVLSAVLAIMFVKWTSLGLSHFHGPAGWGAPLAVIFTAIAMLAKIGEIRVPAWSVWLGGISYSLYLVHLYVFDEVVKTAGRLAIAPEDATAYFLVVRPIAAVLVAYVLYRYVEGPSSEWMRKALMRLSFGAGYRRHGAAPADPAPAGPP